MASGTKIADFFVKIGFDVSKIGDLKAVTEQLNAAATQANALASNLANVEKSLKRLQVPAALKPFVKENKAKDKADQKKKSAFPDEERIGPPLALFKMHMEQQKLAKKEADKAQKESDKQAKDQERQLIRTQRIEERSYKEKLKQKLTLEKLRLKEEKDADKEIVKQGKLLGKFAEGNVSVMDLVQTFGELDAVAVAFSAVTIGAVAGLVKLSNWATQTVEQLFKFKLATGLSTQELQQWQYAAAKAGVNGAEVANSLKSIQTAQAQIALGQGNIAPWALLGINPNQDPNKALWEIHERIKESGGMAPGMARLLTSQLGISEEMFQFLRRDNLELDELNRKLRLSDTAVKSFDKFNQASGQLSANFSALGINIARLFTPFVKFFTEVLSQTINDLATILGYIDDFTESGLDDWMANAFKKGLPYLDKIIAALEWIGQWTSGSTSKNKFGEFKNSSAVEQNAQNLATSNATLSTASSTSNTSKSAPWWTNLEDSVLKSLFVPTQGGNKSTISSQKTVNVTMNIDGSKDPKAVADYAAAAIRKHMNDQHSLVSDLSSVGSFVT